MIEFDSEDCKLKPLKCELHFIKQSDGSAVLSQGDTVVLVSVNGPQDIQMKSQNTSKAITEVIYNSRSGRHSVGDRYKEHAIKQICTEAIISSLYPRTGITITIQELEDCGGLLTCCVNACCLALLNAGVMMRTTFAAVSCGVDDKGNIMLEPYGDDLVRYKATMNFVFDGRDRSLISGFTEDRFSEAAYKEGLRRCQAASEVIFSFYRDIIKQYSKTLW